MVSNVAALETLKNPSLPHHTIPCEWTEKATNQMQLVFKQCFQNQCGDSQILYNALLQRLAACTQLWVAQKGFLSKMFVWDFCMPQKNPGMSLLSWEIHVASRWNINGCWNKFFLFFMPITHPIALFSKENVASIMYLEINWLAWVGDLLRASSRSQNQGSNKLMIQSRKHYPGPHGHHLFFAKKFKGSLTFT